MPVASETPLYRRPAVDAARKAAIVGADGLTRVRVAQLLEAAGYDVVIDAPDPAAETDALDAVIVLDNAQRPAIAHEVRTLCASLPADSLVAVVSTDLRHGVIQSALGAGARAFVAMDRLDEALLPSLAAALAGQLVLPGGRDRQLLSHVLTSREKQVLGLVVMGMTNGEIAGKLFLAESTVKSHLSSAFSKLGVRSRNEAAATILDPNSGVGTGILTIEGHDESPALKELSDA
jgi:DNA-binding NarL/FixJ family response regulator